VKDKRLAEGAGRTDEAHIVSVLRLGSGSSVEPLVRPWRNSGWAFPYGAAVAVGLGSRAPIQPCWY
jgi:hypothetical protein